MTARPPIFTPVPSRRASSSTRCFRYSSSTWVRGRSCRPGLPGASEPSWGPCAMAMPTTERIEAVVFDLGGVLFENIQEFFLPDLARRHVLDPQELLALGYWHGALFMKAADLRRDFMALGI